MTNTRYSNRKYPASRQYADRPQQWDYDTEHRLVENTREDIRDIVDEHLPPERELAALQRAAWLIEREFGADVVVQSADEADDGLASTAEPGRPAIDIES